MTGMTGASDAVEGKGIAGGTAASIGTVASSGKPARSANGNGDPGSDGGTTVEGIESTGAADAEDVADGSDCLFRRQRMRPSRRSMALRSRARSVLKLIGDPGPPDTEPLILASATTSFPRMKGLRECVQ
jgi:hypothetical protein